MMYDIEEKIENLEKDIAYQKKEIKLKELELVFWKEHRASQK